MSKTKILKWRFDVNAFRLFGRELITDRITALVELVKNSYDANATEVYVEFYNVGTVNNANSKIVIRDNGIGMSSKEIEDKWMVVGTNSKRINEFSPEPFKRKHIGEKGIGRFAVDKLGSHLLMITKKENSNEEQRVEIDWGVYEELSKKKEEQLTLFTEVENKLNVKEKIDNKHGTTLIISKVDEVWSLADIDRAYKELARIISPFHRLNPPFKMFLYSSEHEEKFNSLPIIPDPIQYESNEFTLIFNKEDEKQQTLFFNNKNGKIEIKNIDVPSFGLINMTLYYFDEVAKRKFNKVYKKSGRHINGVKIYRDGVLATPFAEFESNSYKQRDILGIDKRLWESTFDKIGSKEIIGLVDISKKRNPNIIDSTNRQDFINNTEYQKLKEFIIHQLTQIEKYKIYNRKEKKKNADKKLKEVNTEFKDAVSKLKLVLKKVKKNNPLLAPELERLETKLTNTSEAVKTIVKVNQKVKKESERKENLYLSLMSLQEYAANLSHAVRTSLGKIKRLAEFFNTEFPNQEYQSLFLTYSGRIYDEINTLGKVVDFMLSYAKAAVDIEEFSVKSVIENLFNNIYRHVFEIEGIKSQVEIRADIKLSGNKKFFEDVFENLIANSIKALAGKEEKLIKCTGEIQGDNFVCYLSDNGMGVKPGDEDKIFEIYYTTTASQGGAGLGLFIVQKRILAFKGDIEVIKPELISGATFRIKLPFKK